MSAYKREEMEEMMRRWLAVNDKAEQEGNWRHLADFFSEDCLYGWDTPNGSTNSGDVKPSVRPASVQRWTPIRAGLTRMSEL